MRQVKQAIDYNGTHLQLQIDGSVFFVATGVNGGIML